MKLKLPKIRRIIEKNIKLNNENLCCVPFFKKADLNGSIYNFNIGRAIKNALDDDIIINGGGHNMAAGFTLKKNNLNKFENYISKKFLSGNNKNYNIFTYDAELSGSAFNKDFYNDIKRIGPFGAGNPSPTFLFQDLKIIKTTILDKKHIH